MEHRPRVVHRTSDGGFMFWCPGCSCGHKVWIDRPSPTTGSTWTFNGDLDRPTFEPSVLIEERPGGFRCHSYVAGGSIRFLHDCSHSLGGETVALKPF